MTDVLYVGSSIFQQWSCAADVWPGRAVENIAVGGTVTAFWQGRLAVDVARWRPRVLCYYCGSNDFNAGEGPAAIAGRTLQTFERVWEGAPELQIAYHSIIKAPQKEEKWGQVDAVNRALREAMADRGAGHFVDLNPVFFDAAGGALQELYVEDRLHLKAEAYRRMVELCRPWAGSVPLAAGEG